MAARTKARQIALWVLQNGPHPVLSKEVGHPTWDPECLSAFSLFSGAFTLFWKSPELHFSPCRKPCPSPVKGRGGGPGVGTSYLSSWDCVGQRASSIFKAALTAGMLCCEHSAPCAALWHSVSAHNLLTLPSPPEMGILKHHKKASPSTEGKHLGLG